MIDLTAIARLCHEANRGVCDGIPDPTVPTAGPWEQVSEAQRASLIDGVKFVLANPDAPVGASHYNWCSFKQEQGWVYGPVKDEVAKTHPCLVAYHDLPVQQQVKDHVFKAIVLAMVH